VTPTSLHAWVVAQWQAKLDVARAAAAVDDFFLGGRWYNVAQLSGPKSDAGLPEPDAAFIIANPPAFAIAVCEAALRRLERHKPWGSGCAWCDATLEAAVHWRYPCPEVLDDASPFAGQPDFPEELKRP
jgi:hypothetical protein